MSKLSSESIQVLIERSSLGTDRARQARASVPLSKGRALASAAADRAAARSGEGPKKSSQG